jgi:Holliday junction resolvase-like predicted endonuclease
MIEKKHYKDRGMMAAVAYLERSGIHVLDQDFKTTIGVIPIVAMDGDELVHVRVIVHTSSTDKIFPSNTAIKKRQQQMAEYAMAASVSPAVYRVRLDDIDIRVLAEDKALLRHYRNVTESEV